MSILSVFVDESGNFNMAPEDVSFYSIAFVFHNQSQDISTYVDRLDSVLETIDYPGTFVHTAPIIRGKDEYANLDRKTRLSIFNRFMQFLNKIPYSYFFLLYDKSDYDNQDALLNKMRKDIQNFINSSMVSFSGFDDIIIYYDDGQKDIAALLRAIFRSTFSSYAKFRHINQKDYRLAQAADFICTMETTAYKWEKGYITKSETKFFQKKSIFTKSYYNQIRRHRIIASSSDLYTIR